MATFLPPRRLRCAGVAALALLAAVTPATAEPMTAETARLVQRMLQYELVLGVQLEAGEAACIDAIVTGEWILPNDSAMEPSRSALGRVHRAREACHAPEDPTRHRQVTAGVRHVLGANLEARKQLASARQDVQSCLQASAARTEFDACLGRMLAAAPDAESRARWATLFERSAGRGPLAR